MRGTRQPSDDGSTVALDYRIEPGPIAELVIEGHPLEPELEQRHPRSVDAHHLRSLPARGHPHAHLAPSDRRGHHRQQSRRGGRRRDAGAQADSRQRSRPGRQVSRRSVRYIRQRAHSTPIASTTVVQMPASTSTAGWTPIGSPRRSRRSIADQGYLSATVKADEPVVSRGRKACSPVTIAEGPRFVVGRLDASRCQPEPAGRRGGRGPARFRRAVRHRRDRRGASSASRMSYARAGLQHRSDRGRTRTPIRTPATVASTFAMLEGLQQILREVTTRGRDADPRRRDPPRAAAAHRRARQSGRRGRRRASGCTTPTSSARSTSSRCRSNRRPKSRPPASSPFAPWCASSSIRSGGFRYGAQFNDERDEVRRSDRWRPSRACRASASCRPAEPEPVRPSHHRRHRRRATSATGRPAACSRRTARSLACRSGRAGLSSRHGNASSIEDVDDDRSAVRRHRRAALAAVPATRK